jgi:hypothetical protein
MAKKVQIFDALMEGFRAAIARKKGRKVDLWVTKITSAKRSDRVKNQAMRPPR